jgi:hypothetical protein
MLISTKFAKETAVGNVKKVNSFWFESRLPSVIENLMLEKNLVETRGKICMRRKLLD